MDGNESDGSEVYFSASECIGDAGTSCQIRPSSALGGWCKTAGGERGIDTPTPAQESGRDCRGGTTRKPATKKFHHQRPDSILINHALTGMNTLYVMWANQKLCDVIIDIGHVSFPAHGVVLATHSDFFLGLLLKEQSDTSTSTRRMSLDSLVTAAGFEKLLGYMYTSEIEITWCSVGEIMQAASALKVTRIFELGEEFLQNYTVGNCLCAMYVAEQVNLTLIFDTIRSFVLANFPAVSRTETFLRCPADMVARLLADDNLSVPDEVEVLLAAKNWILSNGEHGVKNARLVFSQVRLQDVKDEDLARHVYEDQIFLEIPGIKSTIDEIDTEEAKNVSADNASLQSSPSLGKQVEDITLSGRSVVDDDNFQATLLSTAAEIAKEARIMGQSAFLSQKSRSASSIQPFGGQPVMEPIKKRSSDTSSSNLRSKTLLSTAAEIAKEARIMGQSAFLSQKSRSSSSIQPFGGQPVMEPIKKRSSDASNSNLRSKPTETGDANKKDRDNQSASQSPARESPHPISGKHVIASEPRHVTRMGPAPWPMPTQNDLKHATNVTLRASPKASQAPKAPQCYHTPGLISDHRITVSNPKSISCGPIAWPLMKRFERRSDMIVTVGGVAKSGESEIAGRKVEALLLDDNQWLELEPMPHARNHHVVLFLNGFLYVIGGSDPHAKGDDFLKPVSFVLTYDVRKGVWSDAHPMNAARIFHGAAALFGQLYVVGGQDQAGRTLATVECYSPNTDCWRYVAPLPSARYGTAVTVYRNKMWVAGGFSDDNFAGSLPVPRHVVCYNPFRDQWDAMAPLRVPRCHANLLEMANRLFMIGGFVGESGDSEEKSQSESTIETYNESLGMWEYVADVWQGRHDANTVTVDNKAYIIGGPDDDNEDPLPSVECFDPVSTAWDAGIAPLPSGRFGHACCVVPGDARAKLPQY